MPSQRLLAGFELLALVDMVISSELPVVELHEKQVEFPGINASGGCFAGLLASSLITSDESDTTTADQAQADRNHGDDKQ